MSDSIVQLKKINKIFIMGKSKNPRKALRALQHLHLDYDGAAAKHDDKRAAALLDRLEKAQRLFTKELYDESYKVSTGKTLKKRNDKGIVVHALSDINLTIKQGELVAIMGPSGSGKSTLLNMLGLLDEPSAGHIKINDKDITAIKPRDLPNIRSHELGFVFQSFNLITTLTALENVMLPLRYAGVDWRTRRKKAEKALEQVGLKSRLHHLPSELSGGQQQRVAIARSIVNNPAVVFGDEMTGELDTKMTREVMALIQKLNKAGQTFVIVTHNPEVAEYCKRVIHMRDGKVAKDTKVTSPRIA